VAAAMAVSSVVDMVCLLVLVARPRRPGLSDGQCRVPSYNGSMGWFLGGGEVAGTLGSIDCVPEIVPPPPWDTGQIEPYRVA